MCAPSLVRPTATPELRYIYFHSSLNFALYIMLNEEDLLEVIPPTVPRFGLFSLEFTS